ncbi:MAG: B-box zinc finger protein [Candidatus Odinarchaeia archaeon]
MGMNLKCPKHPTEEVIGFCFKCKKPVCRFCGRIVADPNRDFLKGIKVKELIKSLKLDKSSYICVDCDRLKLSISVGSIIGFISGLGLFFTGLFIEFMPLVIVGAFVFIGSIYSIITE